MIGKMDFGEVSEKESEGLKAESFSELPSVKDIKESLEKLFSKDSLSEKESLSDSDSGKKTDVSVVTLDDGSRIKLNGREKGDSVESFTGNSDINPDEVKPTRELTEDEKAELRDKLNWNDSQISKCTVDEDGVIHYKTDREDMEGKTGENGIPYKRKTVEIDGVKIQGVFPEFDSKFDVKLPEELEKSSNVRQFKECNEQLKEAVNSDPDLKSKFSAEQLDDIQNGRTPEGYVWHHKEDQGEMQLVKAEDHDRTQGGAAHTGGKTLWGGGYGNHEITDSDISKEEN